MPEIRKLISTIESYPALYKKKHFEYQKHEDIWEHIAQECQLTDGREAHKVWNKLVDDYTEYMSYGSPFYYSKEMRFMQTHIVDTHSESSEIDEETLLDAIGEDSDGDNASNVEIIPAKRFKKETFSPKLHTKRQMQSKDDIKSQTNVLADFSSSIVTSAMPSEIAGLSSLQLIFLGYAKILQDLPLSIQIRTKHKIAQIINEAELALIEANESKQK